MPDPLVKASLQIELAAVLDTGTPMVQSMFILGDGTLTWQCYEQLYVAKCNLGKVNLSQCIKQPFRQIRTQAGRRSLHCPVPDEWALLAICPGFAIIADLLHSLALPTHSDRKSVV